MVGGPVCDCRADAPRTRAPEMTCRGDAGDARDRTHEPIMDAGRRPRHLLPQPCPLSLPAHNFRKYTGSPVGATHASAYVTAPRHPP